MRDGANKPQAVCQKNCKQFFSPLPYKTARSRIVDRGYYSSTVGARPTVPATAVERRVDVLAQRGQLPPAGEGLIAAYSGSVAAQCGYPVGEEFRLPPV